MPAERELAARRLPILAVVLAPFVIASVLLGLTCHAAIWDCVPFWKDEVWYWNEIAVFHRAAWQGGYTVINDVPAKAEWCHFGTHGPFFPALYGTLTRWTGLYACSIPLLNTSLLILGSIIWVEFGRQRGERTWAALFVVGTFWPLILYLPTSMQATLHFALAFFLAAAVGWLLRRPNSWPARCATLALVLAAAQIRVTWCLLALPVLWIAIRPSGWLRGLTVAAVAAVIMGLSFYEATLLYSPVPNFMREVIERAADSPPDAVFLVAKHAVNNAERYVTPKRGTWLEFGLRWQVILIMGAVVYQLTRGRRAGLTPAATRPNWAATLFGFRPQNTPIASGSSLSTAMVAKGAKSEADQSTEPSGADGVYVFVLLNLLGIVGFVLCFYDVFAWRDYRVVAPHLLLSLLLLVGCRARRWLGGYALVSLVLAAFVVGQFREFHGQRTTDHRASIDALRRDVARAISYVEGAPGWENTILMHVDQLNTSMLGLPAGIGISVVYDWSDLSWPQRSRYLLLRPDEATRLDVSSPMRKVAKTAAGDVYARPYNGARQ